MAIANYSTKVAAVTTVAEIQALLANKGARRIMVEYQAGRPSAISFQIEIAFAGELVSFQLPSNVAGVLAAMRADKSIPRSQCNEAQAERVAWRILRDWLRAQLAIIEAGLVRLEQVMLPYAITRTGHTLYQEFQQHGSRVLALGNGDE